MYRFWMQLMIYKLCSFCTADCLTFDGSPKKTMIQSKALPALYSNPIHKQIKIEINGMTVAIKAQCRPNQVMPRAYN